MPVPMTSGSMADLLDKRVTKIFYDELIQLPDRVSEFFGMQTSKDSFEKWSEVGALQDFTQFNGSIVYQSQNQGYDTVVTHLEWVNGFQIQRTLYDDDRHNIWSQKPSALADSYMRTRQGHAARLFNNAFAVDTFFYVNSEAVPLISDSHTTTSGASTAVGFDNRTTAALSATAVSALRTQMRGFRDDQANRFSVRPNKIVVPIDLIDRLDEIVGSDKQVDTANNNINPQYQRFNAVDWEYLTDTNNWFMIDERYMKKFAVWFDRIPLEFGRAEEFDTFVAKWRAYCRYAYAWFNWRFIAGAQVS
jgi:phage major head subunit gpT-like protein